MIIWSFKEHPETRGDEFPCDAGRWALCAGWNKGPYAELVWQFRFRNTVEWHSSHTDVFGISVTRHFTLGQEHFYYDGCHCMLALGFIHVQWVNQNCKRCHGS